MKSINEKSFLFSNLVIIIPARNEEEAIPKLIKEIRETLTAEIIVINNRSSDKTAERAKELGVTVINENKIGYGSACLAGIRYISSLKKVPRYICFFDGDGQSYVNDIIKVSHPVISGKTNYCQGSRMVNRKSIKALKPMAQFANLFFSTILSIIWKQKITDLGPLRTMTWTTLSDLNMKSSSYGWTIEMTTKILKQYNRHCEVPVHYRLRTSGKSKISGNFKTALFAAFVMILTFFNVFLFWRPPSAKQNKNRYNNIH